MLYNNSMKTYAIIVSEYNERAIQWKDFIIEHLNSNAPDMEYTASDKCKDPDLVLALGGDGTALEAARLYSNSPHSEFLVLHLGTLGFIAPVEKEEEFIGAIDKVLAGNYHCIDRVRMEVKVMRGNKEVYSSTTINDAAIRNLLYVVEVEISIEDYVLQTVKGGGVLISTSTGSTAFNLSAHGPVVSPRLPALLITELLDHSIPTPSFTLSCDRAVQCKIKGFREYKTLKISNTDQFADVVLSVGGTPEPFVLQKDDVVEFRGDVHPAKYIEFDKNSFIKKLHRKFGFS